MPVSNGELIVCYSSDNRPGKTVYRDDTGERVFKTPDAIRYRISSPGSTEPRFMVTIMTDASEEVLYPESIKFINL